MTDIKVFNRWSAEDIEIKDPGLKDYISLQAKIVPQTGGRYAGQRFHKSDTFIVERLINKIMVPGHKGSKHLRTSGHITGKKDHVSMIVEDAFEKIEEELNKNPVEVFVIALEQAAPREEIITVEYGGARYPRAVEIAPQRRIDITLKHMVQGTYNKSFKGKTSVEQALAEEIIEAYNGTKDSTAISKKRSLERQAASAK